MDTIAELLDTHSRRLVTLATVILVILISLSIADTAIFFVDKLGDTAIRPEPVEMQRGPLDDLPDVDLASLNLFGVVAQNAPAQVVDAPETKLNLELQGVFTAVDPENSTAIVAERGKTGELFQIGDRLPGNAVLESVHPDHILIRRGGRVEKLLFADTPVRQQFTPTVSSAAGRLPQGPTAETPDNRLADIRERIAARRRQMEQQQATGPAQDNASLRDQVEQYKERLSQDPQGVMNELGITPVDDGEASGYRLSGGEVNQQALQRAGLQQGDIILSVNGRPVGDVASDQALIDQTMAAGRARVEVQRGSRKFYLTVPIPQ